MLTSIWTSRNPLRGRGSIPGTGPKSSRTLPEGLFPTTRIRPPDEGPEVESGLHDPLDVVAGQLYRAHEDPIRFLTELARTTQRTHTASGIPSDQEIRLDVC
jgi:hypothetical protein